MKTYIAIAALAASVTSGSALADAGGSCHFHGSKPATEQVAIDCANKRVATLVTSGKLPKSWQGAKVDKAELVDGKKGKEWRVSYKDPAATDKTKETLYIILTGPGNFVAANYTGE